LNGINKLATTGTTSFNLDLNDLVEEAFERCGSELRTGYDLRTARRSLNLLTIEWSNRGINLWTIEQGAIVMSTGQATYPLPANTIDLLDQVVRQNNGTTNQIDININRISESTYSTIPNKLTQGRPIQVWINRQSGVSNPTTVVLAADISSTDTTITVSSTANIASSGFIQIDNEIISYPNVSGNQLINCARGQNNTTAAAHITGASLTVANLPSINVWPTPNAPDSQYTFVYWRLRRIQDAGDGVNTEDIPFRFLNAMVAGLAYYLSIKLPNVPGERVAGLKADYEQQFQLAADEDREKASIRFVPRNMSYTR
jgi:hypothetical protein